MERPRIKKVEGKQQQWLLHTAWNISDMVLVVCCQLGGARLQCVQVHFVHHLKDSFKVSNWSTNFFDPDCFVKMPEPAVPWLWNIYKSIIGDYWQNQTPASALVNILMCPWVGNWVGAGLPWMYSKDDNHRSTCLFPVHCNPSFCIWKKQRAPENIEWIWVGICTSKASSKIVCWTHRFIQQWPLGKAFFFFLQFCDIENLANFSKN